MQQDPLILITAVEFDVAATNSLCYRNEQCSNLQLWLHRQRTVDFAAQQRNVRAAVPVHSGTEPVRLTAFACGGASEPHCATLRATVGRKKQIT